MIEDALTARVPFAWFTADEEFGQNPGLCDFLESERLPYVMAIPKNTAFLDTAGTIREIDANARRLPPVGFQNAVMGCDQRFQAAGSYWLMRPPRIGRRRILP